MDCVFDGSMDIVEYKILGKLRIIAYIKDNKIYNVTTMDGTLLTLGSAGDLLGTYEDQILDAYNRSKAGGNSVPDSWREDSW